MMSGVPPIETDLTTIVERAAQTNYAAFGHYIDIMWEREHRPDEELDALVDRIAKHVVEHVDCTACANCCRGFPVGLVPDDIPRLAVGLGLPPADMMHRYVDRKTAAKCGEWGQFQQSPCPLLAGRHCSVYAHRPQSCRDYPALTPDFRWLYRHIAAGAGSCPIIFNVLEHLKVYLGW